MLAPMGLGRPAGAAPGPVPAPAARVASVDLVRGAAMVLMVIDHVRVFSGLPAGGPAPGIFFTRWITHFCAPAFVFLAGTSAYLSGRRIGIPALSRRLVVRGSWLVLLELTFLRLAWTFNLGFERSALAGVIWAIGWCMVLLALLAKLPLPALTALGLALVAGHDLVDPHMGDVVALARDTRLGWLLKVLYVGFFAGPIQLGAGGPRLMVLYSLVPWIGVMALGYAFGRVLTLEPRRRDQISCGIGLGAVALFLLLRGLDLYGDPRPWRAAAGGEPTPLRTLMAVLNTSKYPASLAFLLMTLGPILALLPWLERARGAVADCLSLFGRVPLFFYLLHVPLVHALALFVARVRDGAVSPWLFADHPMAAPPAPEGYAWSLTLVYAAWAAAVVLLFFPCRWLARRKARRDGARLARP
jgi:uncharacterized membrane protein